MLDKLEKHLTEGNQDSHAGTKSSILCFHSAESYSGLELRFPDKRHVRQLNDVPSPGEGTGSIFGRVSTIKSGKVCIHKVVQAKVLRGNDGGPFVLSAEEIADNLLNRRGMRLFWRIGEPGDLTDGEGYVWPRVG